MEAWQLGEHARQINQATAAFIEVQGMIAENNQRKIAGESMAYTQEHFQDVLDMHDLGYNQIIEKSRNFY